MLSNANNCVSFWGSSSPPRTQLRNLIMTFPILLAFTQSRSQSQLRALRSCSYRHWDIRVGFLYCNPWLKLILLGYGAKFKIVGIWTRESSDKTAEGFDILMYFYNLQDYPD